MSEELDPAGDLTKVYDDLTEDERAELREAVERELSKEAAPITGAVSQVGEDGRARVVPYTESFEETTLPGDISVKLRNVKVEIPPEMFGDKPWVRREAAERVHSVTKRIWDTAQNIQTLSAETIDAFWKQVEKEDFRPNAPLTWERCRRIAVRGLLHAEAKAKARSGITRDPWQ